MKIGDRVTTISGSGKIVDYHSFADVWAVDLDRYIGREWFAETEMEIDKMEAG